MNRLPLRGLVLFAAILGISGMVDAGPPAAGAAPPHATGAKARRPLQAPAVLGAALSIVADGTAPWEDRPIDVAGLGTLPGKRGVADPGDDLGPKDQVVRSWDAVVYRASFSVRDAPAEGLVAEVVLGEQAVFESAALEKLRLAGCPGGATLDEDGHRLRCLVGRVEAPPAVTVALDLLARVSGAALQGDVISATLSVRAPGAVPDVDIANCPEPQAEGCHTAAKPVTVSAVPAGELQKRLLSVSRTTYNGEAGRQLSWQLSAVLGADGDVRGSSALFGAPWTLPDWWWPTTVAGRHVDLDVTLVGCTEPAGRGDWACAQPGGPGTQLEVTLKRLDATTSLSNGVSSNLPTAVTRLDVNLFVPESELLETGTVVFENCFATPFRKRKEASWRPVDARGQPNLGGLAEPLGNNCSYAVLVVPVTPTPYPPPRPGRPVTPVPFATAVKQYAPYTLGEAVTEGTEFKSEVRVNVWGGGVLRNVQACDKWDNSTHVLTSGSSTNPVAPDTAAAAPGARVWWQSANGGSRRPAEELTRYVIEYAAGRWGKLKPPNYSPGWGWYEQSTADCSTEAPEAGYDWVTANAVDFNNRGGGRMDANAVNMVRARFLQGIPVGTVLTLEVPLKALANPHNTWLMNYAALGGQWGVRGTWWSPSCYAPIFTTPRPECPVPPNGARYAPGQLGDNLVYVAVPLWIAKRTDPSVVSGSPVITASTSVTYVLAASTFPRPFDPPPPAYPPEAIARGVVVTDTLPAGLVYLLGSATVADEDLNGSGALEAGEDRNGNGVIDRNVPYEPAIAPGPAAGTQTLRWWIGDLPYLRLVPEIRYAARTSRLIPGGTALENVAAISASTDFAPDCSPRARELERGRCAWAQVIVANMAAAEVEKVPEVPIVLPGDPLVYQLALANLTQYAVEWFDAVDILPRAGEPRSPVSRLAGNLVDVSVAPLGAPGDNPIEVWASASDPDALDTRAGSPRDGLVDPVAAWGGPGAGLGGPDWPCRLADVGTAACRGIAGRGRITALRLWGADPRPGKTGAPGDSFLPSGGGARRLTLTLTWSGLRPADLAHNAWGGRFADLPLPVFDDAIIVVRDFDTPTPTVTPTASDTPQPSPTFTPSATFTPSPSPTPSDTPTVTPSPTPSLTPSITPTPTPTPVYICYLPAAVKQKCVDEGVDVVLVIDVSSSMLRAAGDGGTKLEAVLRAARAFVERFEPDAAKRHVGVVAFNDNAWIIQPPTGNAATIEAALASLPSRMAEGTRLDLGLQAGATALRATGPGRLKAMIFLTDGLPNRVPTPIAGGSQEDTVLAAAAAARAEGIRIHTVGYGRADAPDLADRILPELLKAVAGPGGAYHETDDASELAAVFRKLAFEVGCIAGSGSWP